MTDWHKLAVNMARDLRESAAEITTAMLAEADPVGLMIDAMQELDDLSSRWTREVWLREREDGQARRDDGQIHD
jgi:hypothetical protein